MSFNFLSLFTNDALCDNNGKSYTVKDALGGKKVVLVYFSAHWCPPCRTFTPVLSAAVQAMKDNGDSVEGVFVSSDRDENSFKEYHGSMSFLALPFSERELKGTLAGKFGVNGIPKLMILDGDTGKPIVEDGRGTITKYGAFGFPFTKEALEEAEKKKDAARSDSMKALNGLQLLGEGAHEMSKNFDEIVLFLGDEDCRGTQQVLPKVLSTREAMIMNGKNVGFLFVPWPALPQSLDVQMPVASCDATAAKVLKAVLGDDISSPHVAVIDAKGTKVIKDDCVRELYNFGAAAYPYTRDAVAKAEAAMKAEKSEKTKGSVQGLAMFTKAGVNELVKADGSTVKVEDVAKKQKVGLYFSAHWCGPCRNFTPKLAQHYKEKLGTVVDEVIFISSDRDDKSFGEYHATMPWCALPFSQRDLKNQISALFDVEGIPTLTIVNPVTGEVLEEDATSSI